MPMSNRKARFERRLQQRFEARKAEEPEVTPVPPRREQPPDMTKRLKREKSRELTLEAKIRKAFRT